MRSYPSRLRPNPCTFPRSACGRRVGSKSVRRGSIVRVVSIGVIVGIAATAVAIFIPWLPDRASEEGKRIDFVFWFVTGICIVIFSVVAAVSVYSVFKFRARPDDDSDG